MPKNQSAKPIEIKIATVAAVPAIQHDADLALFDAALRDMTGGESDYFTAEFACRTTDWNALIAKFKSHRLNPENGVRKTEANLAIEPSNA